MLDSIFLQISFLLGITVTVAFFMRLLRTPLMTAYLIAGIVAGPLFLNLLHGDVELFDALAEFGVVLLLFVVGLSLNFEHIKRIGKVSLIVGITQVSFTAVVGFTILQWLGFSNFSAAYLAMAMTFSSTIVITKLLGEKKDTQSVYGRHTYGLMIVQDIIALLLLVVLTTLGQDRTIQSAATELIIKIILLAGLVYFLSRFVIPSILERIASSSEFLFIFTVAWCFVVASFLHWLGFSVEVGALIAGLTLGSSVYQPEIASRVKPLRDFFIVMFFIILGSQLSLSSFDVILIPGLILSLFILLGNSFILFRMFRALKFTRRNSFLAGVVAGQVSEFGFILLLAGREHGHIVGHELEIFTFVALVTIIISSYVVTYNEQIYRFLLPVFQLFGEDKHTQREDKAVMYDVWVFGYHRIGWKVCESLREQKISFAVVDFNPGAIRKLHARGIPAFFGDAADVEFLEQLPLEKAKMIISTLPEYDDQKTMIRHVRSKSKKPIIVVNLYHTDHLDDMYKAGATYVMMPHLLGGAWMAEILKDHPWTKTFFKELKGKQKEEMKLRFSHESPDID
jgi:Kef-type K+ transport system membrane component KefB